MSKKITGRKRDVNPRLKDRIENRKTKIWRTALFVMLIIVSWAILSINFLPEQVSLTEGEIASDDYFYEGSTVTYVSEIRTEEARNEAAAGVEEQYIVDDTVLTNLLQEIDGYFDTVLQTASGDLSINELKAALPGEYTNEVLYSITGLSQEDITTTRDSFKRMVESIFEEGVLEKDIEDARQSIALAISASTISGNVELFLKSLN
mgnify:FL=1